MNRLILLSELGVRPKLRFWAKMSSKQTQKNRTSTNLAFQLKNPIEMVKKHVRLWNRSILISEIGVSSKLQCWEHLSSKQTQKNMSARNSASELTNRLEMVEKHVRLWNRLILMSEIVVRPKLRCWAKMSMKQTRKVEIQ